MFQDQTTQITDSSTLVFTQLGVPRGLPSSPGTHKRLTRSKDETEVERVQNTKASLKCLMKDYFLKSWCPLQKKKTQSNIFILLCESWCACTRTHTHTHRFLRGIKRDNKHVKPRKILAHFKSKIYISCYCSY